MSNTFDIIVVLALSVLAVLSCTVWLWLPVVCALFFDRD